MTTTLTTPETTDRTWTREENERAVAQGVFGPDDRVELIEGVIVPKMPQNPPHATALTLTDDALRVAFGRGYLFRSQMPLSVGTLSQPEPDLAIILGSPRDYGAAQPGADRAVLVVEVSDSSLAYDQTEKALLYARGGIGDYWIVNLVGRVLEVRRGPSDEGYQETLTFTEADSVAPLAAGNTLIAVADLLP